MLAGSYRKRLEADLEHWVTEGIVSPQNAAAIRATWPVESGGKLVAVLGMLGGLLIAAALAAFVAANWGEISRPAKFGMILVSVIVTLGLASWLQARGAKLATDGAATCGVLCFSAGVALIGQMYHLPGDWPAGALLIGVGALAVAFLQGANGPLIVAFIAFVSWFEGRWYESDGAPQLAFLIAWLPALWLALGRRNRLVDHAAVLALGFWLVLLPGKPSHFLFLNHVPFHWLVLAAVYVLVGAIALSRDERSLISACLPWGLIGLIIVLNLELLRALEPASKMVSGPWPGVRVIWSTNWPMMAVPIIGIAGMAACLTLVRNRHFAVPLGLAIMAALLVPFVFWGGFTWFFVGRVAIGGLILACSVGLIVAGAAGGVRRITVAGAVLFGSAILTLLSRTVGSLLTQSLFFLVAGVVLLALALVTRWLFARLARPAVEAA